MLIKEELLPPQAKDHSLLGEYEDTREFHISGEHIPNFSINYKTIIKYRIIIW